MSIKLDILAIGVHPDDVELGCSGTIVKHLQQGKKVGIVDLTEGQLGSRGTPELRLQEAAKAAEILGVQARENLHMADGFFKNDKAHQLKVIEQIRRFRPEIILCNAVKDRHPDHGRSSELVSEACFLSGLVKIETEWEGSAQEHWRPNAVYHYIQDWWMEPDVIVDITAHFDQKMEAILAFGSQFYNPESTAPLTPISGKEYLEFIKGRSMQFGRLINVSFGEGFTVERPIGSDDLTVLK
jgi:bacillithiol biosynthesis deacetylase BshB1